MAGQFRIISNSTKFLNDEHKRLDGINAEIATDILNRAIMNAPKDSGALVRSGRVKKKANGSYTVAFGDNSVRYAYRRHYENDKNPQTLKYLEKAGDSVQKGNIKKYFR